MQNKGLYVHIPFCDHKCIYCDFYSIITNDNINSFLDSLKKEISYYSALYGTGKKFSTIYLGGGTPSLMDPSYITAIIDKLYSSFSLDSDAEITLETNPGTVNKEKLKSFKDSGVNRLSVGVQSFDNSDLKFLTRIHNCSAAIETIKNAAEIFDNISLDLIFNLPGQTREKWMKNLKQAVKLPVKHISAYSLILERGTILKKMVLDRKINLNDDDSDADLYELTINYLSENGFRQYEVSNFSKPGFECKHNLIYWQYGEYLGFGTSAHSFINRKRWWNFSSLKRYISEIDLTGKASAGEETLSTDKSVSEYIMLALRSTGLNVNEFITNFGEDGIKKNYSYFETLINKNFAVKQGGIIRLTPKGYAVCDEILTKISF